MLNTYFKIGDYLCHVDRYDRETGLWAIVVMKSQFSMAGLVKNLLK